MLVSHEVCRKPYAFCLSVWGERGIRGLKTGMVDVRLKDERQ